jgi:hypothetical protein
MLLRLTARGSTAVNMFAWITSVTAIMIGVVWFIQNNPIAYMAASDRLDEDLWQLSQRLNDACSNTRYYSAYNPLSEKGVVSFNKGEVCIEVTLTSTLGGRSRVLHKCVQVMCQIGVQDSLDLGSLTAIIIDTAGDDIIRAN